MARGDGRAFRLVVSVPVGEADRLVSTSAIPGPFVVVHASVIRSAFPSCTAELLILGASGLREVSGGALPNVGGGRFMPAGERQLEEGQAMLGLGFAQTVAVTLWPWTIYEGQSGAIGLLVRRTNALNLVEVVADCSVWPLVVPGAPAVGRGNPNGRHRSSLAAWRGGG